MVYPLNTESPAPPLASLQHCIFTAAAQKAQVTYSALAHSLSHWIGHYILLGTLRNTTVHQSNEKKALHFLKNGQNYHQLTINFITER